jgi:ATP-dependent Clp protease ATP-binding subunit ClpC
MAPPFNLVSPVAQMQARRLQRRELATLQLTNAPVTGGDPLWAFTGAAQDALSRAQDAAERSRQPWIGTSHLLQGLADVSEGRAALAMRRLGADAVGLASAEPEEAGAEPSGRRLPTRQVRRAMRRAQEEAERDGAAQIGTDHLLLGLLLDPDSRVAEALETAGVSEAALRSTLGDLAPEE